MQELTKQVNNHAKKETEVETKPEDDKKIIPQKEKKQPRKCDGCGETFSLLRELKQHKCTVSDASLLFINMYDNYWLRLFISLHFPPHVDFEKLMQCYKSL